MARAEVKIGLMNLTYNLMRYLQLTKGRLNKAAAYARNAIPEYWILSLRDRRLEVYRRPSHGAYAERTLLTAGKTISLLTALALRVEIAALLP